MEGLSSQVKSQYRAGIGLKPQHYQQVLDDRPDVGFFEVHAENYMGDGGLPHHYLTEIGRHYPLSLHGVALSIGGPGDLDRAHLARLNALLERHDFMLFSEHLAWSTHEGVYLDDLLPLPYTAETLDRVCSHIDEVQETLRCRMLLENPATYVQFEQSTMSETDFIRAVVRRTGCRLLLDVNNVFVSCGNHNCDPALYLDAFPLDHVGEIHLAGHDLRVDDCGAPLLIDSHGSDVADPVWALFRRVIERTGALPTLIERDADVPPLADLAAEARRASAILHESSLQVALG